MNGCCALPPQARPRDCQLAIAQVLAELLARLLIMLLAEVSSHGSLTRFARDGGAAGADRADVLQRDTGFILDLVGFLLTHQVFAIG